jgi:hypothetical protein
VWANYLGQAGATPQIIYTATLPTGATGFSIFGALWWTSNDGSSYGTMVPVITITNSTNGFNLQLNGSQANFRVINYMNYPTTGVALGGQSNLPATGQYVIQFAYAGNYYNTSQALGNYQYMVTYW